MNWHHLAMSFATAAWLATGVLGLPHAVGAESARAGTAPTQKFGPPPAGRYNAQLCVSTAAAAGQCGPVALQFQSGGARVQVSDLVYHLNWRAPNKQMLLVLMHGRVQVDEFVTEGLWSQQSLSFKDPDKDVRYEVRWEVVNRR
ncbi:MAG: hypothetical protein HEQ39_00600 [Rhizobacter sp.]